MTNGIQNSGPVFYCERVAQGGLQRAKDGAHLLFASSSSGLRVSVRAIV